jgi:hypothetical protein
VTKYHHAKLSEIHEFSSDYTKDRESLKKEIEEYQSKLGFVDSVAE